MQTYNLRLTRNVLLSTLALACLLSGLPWLEALVTPLILLCYWPKARVITPEAALKGAMMTHRLALTITILCLVGAIGIFIDTSHDGTAFVRKPLSQWRVIYYCGAWCLLMANEGTVWWKNRSQNFTGPEAKA